MDSAILSETRREYFPVGSTPTSLLATVSEKIAESIEGCAAKEFKSENQKVNHLDGNE
jgi:hypothetical protein